MSSWTTSGSAANTRITSQAEDAISSATISRTDMTNPVNKPLIPTAHRSRSRSMIRSSSVIWTANITGAAKLAEASRRSDAIHVKLPVRENRSHETIIRKALHSLKSEKKYQQLIFQIPTKASGFPGCFLLSDEFGQKRQIPLCKKAFRPPDPSKTKFVFSRRFVPRRAVFYSSMRCFHPRRSIFRPRCTVFIPDTPFLTLGALFSSPTLHFSSLDSPVSSPDGPFRPSARCFFS